jgi:hypothetical protein
MCSPLGHYNPEIIGINGVEVVKLYCEPTDIFSPILSLLKEHLPDILN